LVLKKIKKNNFVKVIIHKGLIVFTLETVISVIRAVIRAPFRKLLSLTANSQTLPWVSPQLGSLKAYTIDMEMKKN
jgi:hypothetical protein